MSELNFTLLENFIEAVKAGAEESASAFARTFDINITLQPKKGGQLNTENLPPSLGGKGLALLLLLGSQGVAVVIPSETGLVPDWCDAPDATGTSKLSTFAQEWAMNLIPEDFFADDFKIAIIQNLSQGILRAMPELDAGFLELALSKEDGSEVSAYIIWPLTEPEKFLEEPKTAFEEIPEAPSMRNAPPAFGGQSDPFGGGQFGNANFANTGMPQHHRLEDLPGYARSVLKVKVPVATILARGRKPIKTILELGVGSIIQFDKSCDDMLEIEVGQTIVVALAEAVKVGDKFGFRISTLRLPEERFRRVEVRREGEYHGKSDLPQIIGKAPIKSFDKKRST